MYSLESFVAYFPVLKGREASRASAYKDPCRWDFIVSIRMISVGRNFHHGRAFRVDLHDKDVA
jgi:hypothetical protein